MARLGLETDIQDQAVYQRTVARFREAGIRLPTLGQLANPATIPEELLEALANVGPDDPHPLNLFRVHWYNGLDRRDRVATPHHLVLPESLTGTPARIVVALGGLFPMITAHKVLAAYGCLAPRLVTGAFDPTTHRAIWPSTGNYCRGGVAISRIMRCRGMAVLPEGMSRERFDWLEGWVTAPEDIVRTVGTESNVKEIYDACNALDQDPHNIIFNQFSEFGNYLVHRMCTGRALGHIFESLLAAKPGLKLRAYVSATGSGGTLAAGDFLKERYGASIAAVEALECPTLLYNGFGEHNIQGIGDKHVPLIHNVMNTDYVVALSDRVSDSLGVLFSSGVGRRYLCDRQGVPDEIISRLEYLGLSSIANVAAAIKLARYMDLGPEDVILTVATDTAAMYATEHVKAEEALFGGAFDGIHAAETYGEHVRGLATDHLLELSLRDRHRIFNLGYYTWVEQQGISLHDFEVRRDQAFWKGLLEIPPIWDEMITRFNRDTGLGS